MNRIHVLDQNTINQIAAGEVIDRPASVVKELLENAIDAKATMITVEIKDGGTSLIRITDNGIGFERDDIRIAFLRHSTSKIKTALDLLSVSSLGFRGEALSSIAAVCQVELITKTEDMITGTRYKIEGGKELCFEEVGAPRGTTFLVRNIFFNTPARRKFLKTAQTETGYISDIIEKIALSHPEISINFISNGQNKIHTPGNGNLKDVIYNIYGRDITNNLLPVHFENEYMTMSGYIGKAVISKGNRSFENYFINGRYIKSNIISKAIEEGYKFILMQHKYPFTVINFQINQEFLDVNVHPAKMELRFRKAESIYPNIVETIHNTLIEKPNIIDVTLDKQKEEKKEAVHVPEPFETKRYQINNATNESVLKEESAFKNKNEIQNRVTDKTVINDTSAILKQQDLQNTESVLAQEVKIQPVDKKQENHVQQQDSQQNWENVLGDDFLSEKAREKHKLIGQVFGTYWIVEYENKMYIIDQHAAHEKVLFESLMDKLSKKEISTQMINPPIILNLSMKEADLFEKYADNFKEIGFDIESFGGQDYTVRGIPTDLYTLDSYDVLMEIIDNLSDEAGKMVPDMITDKIASMSCKAAVKGNSAMSRTEADALIEQLLSLENPYNCPHGRPTIISMSKYELEKKFKRII